MKSVALVAFTYLIFCVAVECGLRLVMSTNKDNMGSVAGPGFLIAIKEIRESELMRGGAAGEILWKAINVDGSDRSVVANYFQVLDDFHPHLIISFAQYNLALLTGINGTAYIAASRGADLFATLPKVFPTFITTRFGTEYFGKIVRRMMEHYKWTRVAIINSYSDIQRIRSEELKKFLQKAISPCYVYSFVFPDHVQESIGYDTFEPTVRFMLSYLKTRTIFFILLMDNKDIRFVLKIARNMGFCDGNFIFLTYGAVENIGLRGYTDYTELEGVLTVDQQPPQSSNNDFLTRLEAEFEDNEWKTVAKNWTKSVDFGSELPRIIQAKYITVYSYTAMKMWWNALETLMKDSSGGRRSLDSVADDGKLVASEARKLRATGIEGLMKFAPSGWHLNGLAVSLIQGPTRAEVVLNYDEVSDKIRGASSGKTLVWMGQRSGPPSEPDCFAEECEKRRKRFLIFACLSALGGVLGIVILGIAAVIIFKRRQEKKIIAKWKINWDEVTTIENNAGLHNNYSPSRSSVNRILTRSSNSVRLYQNRTIVVKFIERESLNIYERTLYKELKQMLYVRHLKVNPFVGVCVDAPNVCTAMAYAAKGSLRDVLADDQQEMEWELRMSLASDIAEGMEYLHTTPIGAHGHLTSGNCVVDDQWVCKITDYGLKLFRCLDKSPKAPSELLWTAPEILHKKDGQPERIYGTKPGDVYSFGIIVSELLTRELPYKRDFGVVAMEELLTKIKLAVEPPFRPPLPFDEEGYAGDWIVLARNCWQTNPSKRPTFKDITSMLDITSSGRYSDVQERTQSELEAAVDRVTGELKMEKRKTEAMLHSSLPAYVVDAVMSSKEVEPQLVESVTLCLCDTTGIYKITRNLSAEKIVTIMESVYDNYDEITERYKAYEVGTWASKDTMLLAGGLPSNLSTDADKMCSLAVDMLDLAKTFVYPQLKNGNLKIKATLHKGHVYTSVVAEDMPKFCVFGAAVQTVIDLHMFTKFMTIRLSDAVRSAITESDKFEISEAGSVTLSDGGHMTTYFLTANDGRRKSNQSTADDNERSGVQRRQWAKRRKSKV